MSTNPIMRMMRVGLAVAALVALASGCLHSKLDENWGKSHEAQMVWQRANPEAPATSEPPESLDPETAKRVAERYYKGQEKQRQREAPTIVIGEE
jgi:hypothetical protein